MKDSLQTTLENAKTLFQKGHFEVCKKQFHELLTSNYEPFTCHYYLGLIDLNLKNYDQAVNEFSICLKGDPHNVNCLYYLGTVSELQGNKDLALHYYYKTLKENPEHVNAKKATERLGVAYKTDISQQGSQQNRSNQNTSSAHSSPREMDRDRSGPIQLYDELLMAKDPDSQIAAQMIQATAVRRRPRFRAFIGLFFLRVLVLPFALTALLAVIPVSERMPFAAKYNFQVMINWYIFFVILCLIYHLIWVKTTIINIDRGFIEITKGVFSRNKKLFLCHKADHFEVHQNFFNLITGDCTLLFDLDTGHNKGKLQITGLGRVKDINRLATNLQNLRYQLRNTPAIRSGIYG